MTTSTINYYPPPTRKVQSEVRVRSSSFECIRTLVLLPHTAFSIRCSNAIMLSSITSPLRSRRSCFWPSSQNDEGHCRQRRCDSVAVGSTSCVSPIFLFGTRGLRWAAIVVTNRMARPPATPATRPASPHIATCPRPPPFTPRPPSHGPSRKPLPPSAPRPLPSQPLSSQTTSSHTFDTQRLSTTS